MDDKLRELLFKEFHIKSCRFDFLEALLFICITGVGYLLRTPFEAGIPSWIFLLAEWYTALAAAVLIRRATKSRKRALGTYAILMILPTTVAEGTILRGNGCVGALLLICALLFLQQKKRWLFVLISALLLLWSVKYIGILFACMVLWQRERLKSEHLLVLLLAGGARFMAAYHAWLGAGYTLDTFHWFNIYEIVGKEAVQGQLIDPGALVGLFLALGGAALAVYVCSLGKSCETDASNEMYACLHLLLFFGLLAGYLLPYMDQSYGYLYGILGVLYFMLSVKEFFVPMLLQIVVYGGYQECFNGVSMMPGAVFAAIQFLLILWLGVRLLQEAKIFDLCRQKS
ncbi:MAG TPA: hypothetical protein DD414_10220 [Lachnospiraceae bacterium]|nr:hypothetical protein [Lachnospiraceae bacterium]